MATGTREVVDFSYSRIDMALAKSQGVLGCMRYLYRNGKGLTAPELTLFRVNAMALGLNYEAGSGDFIGYDAGVTQARAAEQIAIELGVGGNVIIFSADWPVASWQYQAVGDAVAGALSVKGDGKVGCYGHAGLMAYLRGRFGLRIFYWQTYAWSGGFVSPYADLYQFLNGQDFAGGQVDFNDIRGRTFWAVGSTGHTTSGGNATPIEEDDSMSAADVAALEKWMFDQFEQVKAALTTEALRQANQAVGPALEAIAAETAALQALRKDFGDTVNQLKNAGLIPKTPAAPATPQV